MTDFKKIFDTLMIKAKENETVNKKNIIEECLCKKKEPYYYIKQDGNKKKYEICPVCNPRKTCNECNGTGHIVTINNQKYTQVSPFACECRSSEFRILLLNEANIPDKYLLADYTFTNFKKELPKCLLNLSEEMITKYKHNLLKVRDFCLNTETYIKNKDNNDKLDKYFLLLTGPVGTGKTYLAICALIFFIADVGYRGKFIDFQMLLHEIKEAYINKAVSEGDIMNPLRNIDILVIDEMGKGRTENEWELEKLDDLINYRYNNSKITIITTNYLPKEILETINDKKNQKYANPSHDVNNWNRANDKNIIFQDNNSLNHSSESFANISLQKRIGERIYDRLLEASIIVDFTNITSFRKNLAQKFLNNYKN